MMTVAIVGRPNVGKSTLFNRILHKRIAIVDSISGTTRDRLYGEADWEGCRFIVIDTGGIDLDTSSNIKEQILNQIRISINQADLIIFVTDAVYGIVPMDKEIDRLLRHCGKEVIVAVNKVDNEKLRQDVYSFANLGWNTVIGISSLHGLGIDKLLDIIVKKARLSPLLEEKKETDLLKVSVIGKPNVGKSTFINTVLNEPRMIVDEKPGTTRDAVDIKFNRHGNPWLFIDTAGMRKRNKVKIPVEYYSVRRAYTSIDRSNIVILMIDGWEGIARQDAQLLDYITKKLKPCVIAVNKWDLVGITVREYKEKIGKRIREHWYIPAVFISALKKENIDNLLDTAENLYKQSQTKIPTNLLNKALRKITPTRTVRIYYGTQTNINPLTFLLFVNTMPDKGFISHIYNQLRKEFEISVPIVINFRARNTK